jgi:hypothetical protein
MEVLREVLHAHAAASRGEERERIRYGDSEFDCVTANDKLVADEDVVQNYLEAVGPGECLRGEKKEEKERRKERKERNGG